MSTVQQLLHAAQELSAAERAQLLHALWESTSPDDWQPPSEDWIAEAQRRSEALDAGK
jgi:hypothetical protein